MLKTDKYYHYLHKICQINPFSTCYTTKDKAVLTTTRVEAYSQDLLYESETVSLFRLLYIDSLFRLLYIDKVEIMNLVICSIKLDWLQEHGYFISISCKKVHTIKVHLISLKTCFISQNGLNNYSHLPFARNV